ncbi:hypothetical protein EI94DRAFT_1702767 [Lactarius quietus]|nr:hypothetical protein EI94DRAFT_1702767 [Lactarius quietus]
MYVFQMTPELIAEINQSDSMGTGIPGVIFAGTEFTPERVRGEGRPNSRSHELEASPCGSIKREQVIPGRYSLPPTLSETQVQHAGSPKYLCFSQWSSPATTLPFTLTAIAKFDQPRRGRLSAELSHPPSKLPYMRPTPPVVAELRHSIADGPINPYRVRRISKRMKGIITRKKNATNGFLPGATMVGQPGSMVSATTHVPNAMAVNIMFKSNERTRTKRSGSTAAIMSIRKILIAYSPKKHKSSISNDTKSRQRTAYVLGADSHIRCSKLREHTTTARITDRIQLLKSILLVPSPLLTKSPYSRGARPGRPRAANFPHSRRILTPGKYSICPSKLHSRAVTIAHPGMGRTNGPKLFPPYGSARPMQFNALNNGGMISDSMRSLLSTPSYNQSGSLQRNTPANAKLSVELCHGAMRHDPGPKNWPRPFQGGPKVFRNIPAR